MPRRPTQILHLVLRVVAGAFLGALGIGTASAGAATPNGQHASLSPSARSWCSAFGSSIVAWSETTPNIPICGPGPDYGGTWAIVTLPGPGGMTGAYFNGTPGFQCVELAERYLAVADGFGPIDAEGATVAANYHAMYPRTTLVVNGSPGAVGHAPVRGDVVSFSLSPSFDEGDGHVAVVVGSRVNQHTGNGTVELSQQNVASADYHYTIDLSHWRLEDPTELGNAEFQFPYAEWMHVEAPSISHRRSVFVAPSAVMSAIAHATRV